MFNLHLNAMCQSLPWFHTAGRRNYDKYVPCYITDMKRPEQKHPEFYQHLCQGGFVVQCTGHYHFNAVSTDQALEQPLTKRVRVKEVLLVLPCKKMRWLVTLHVTAKFSDNHVPSNIRQEEDP